MALLPVKGLKGYFSSAVVRELATKQKLQLKIFLVPISQVVKLRKMAEA